MFIAVFAVTAHRRQLLAASAAAYGIVFAATVLVPRPALGIGHLFYVAVVLAALALGTGGGAAGGLTASLLYTLSAVVSRGFGPDVITAATAIRLITFCVVGIVVGRFASSNHKLVGELQELANRDFLTGADNTRVFDEALTERCGSGFPFVLVLGDMDGLKSINDN